MRPGPLVLHVTLLVQFLALPALTAPAPQPERITFQGRLTDAAGNPVPDGNVPMTFSIYDTVSGGTPLWSETQTIVVNGGLYSAQIGTVNDFSSLTVNMTDGRWLGVTAGSDGEMTPRYPLTGVPYARRALGADTADAAADADTLDGLHAAAFARLAAANTFTSTNLFASAATFNDLTLRLRNAAGTAQTSLGTYATATRTVRFPDATGTVVTTGNLGDINAVGLVKSGTWEGTAVDVAHGGTGTDTVGAAGAVAYSTGAAYAFLAPEAGGPVLHSGSHGAPPYWDAVNLASATQTTGVLPETRGGTGLDTPGAAGNFLKSDGSNWTSSAIQAADLPAGIHLARDAADASSASNAGPLYDFTNTSTTSGAIGLLSKAPAGAISGGTFTGLRGEAAASDNASDADSSSTSGIGVLGSSTGASLAAAALTQSTGVYGSAAGTSITGSTFNRGVWGAATGGGTVTNHGVFALASGATSGTNIGVYGQAFNSTAENFALYGSATASGGTAYGLYATASGGDVNWAGYFAGDVNVSTRLAAGQVESQDGTAVAPAYRFMGDPDTGIFHPADNTLSLSTGGTERVRITSSGDVLVSGRYRFTEGRTYSKGVSPAEFTRSVYDDVMYAQIYVRAAGDMQVVRTATPPHFVFIVAGVSLPQGATITGFTAYLRDNHAEGSIACSAFLSRRNYVHFPAETMASVSSGATTGASGVVQPFADDTIENALIDNSNYQYFIHAQLTTDNILSTSEDLTFLGCKIDYTIQTLNP